MRKCPYKKFAHVLNDVATDRTFIQSNDKPILQQAVFQLEPILIVYNVHKPIVKLYMHIYAEINSSFIHSKKKSTSADQFVGCVMNVRTYGFSSAV